VHIKLTVTMKNTEHCSVSVTIISSKLQSDSNHEELNTSKWQWPRRILNTSVWQWWWN